MGSCLLYLICDTHTHKHEFYGTWSISLYFLNGLKLFQCSMWDFLNKPPAAVVQTWKLPQDIIEPEKLKLCKQFLAKNYGFKFFFKYVMFC